MRLYIKNPLNSSAFADIYGVHFPGGLDVVVQTDDNNNYFFEVTENGEEGYLGVYYILDINGVEESDQSQSGIISRNWTGYTEDMYINFGVNTEAQVWSAEASASQIIPICFAKGTIVSTDQGNMEIQNIVPGKHTIGEKAICHITKTISPEKKIVCVKKNAFGKNKPNKAITMSGNHCIQCEKGAMVKAKELVANNRNMKFVEYNQEPLYNVLMEDHNVIKVQNLEVETLDPENIVAKIHNSLMDKSILAKLVKQMNEGIRENNREKYLIAEETIRKG